MTPPTEQYHEENSWQVQDVPDRARGRLKSYTAFSRWPDMPRGEYGEEVDVRALSPAAAKRIAQDYLDRICEPRGKIVRLVFRPDGFMFM